LTIQYEAIIHGDDKQVTIDYLVTLRPNLVNYVLNSGNGDAPTVLDVSWMGFTIKNPVMITTKQYGNLEINFPLGVIQNQIPDAYDVLKEIPQDDFLKANLIDASSLVDYPIDRWNSLFDPEYILDQTAGYGYVGQKVAETGLAYGHSDLSNIKLKQKTSNMDFTVDSKYHISTLEKSDSGTIDVEGHANAYLIQGYPAISTTLGANPTYAGCPGCLTPDQSLFRSILVISIVGAAVIGFWVFYFRRFRE
jgi:hypothetical protein